LSIFQEFYLKTLDKTQDACYKDTVICQSRSARGRVFDSLNANPLGRANRLQSAPAGLYFNGDKKMDNQLREIYEAAGVDGRRFLMLVVEICKLALDASKER